jgi:hypothetical protein
MLSSVRGQPSHGDRNAGRTARSNAAAASGPADASAGESAGPANAAGHDGRPDDGPAAPAWNATCRNDARTATAQPPTGPNESSQ